jgi:hypothetical protein
MESDRTAPQSRVERQEQVDRRATTVVVTGDGVWAMSDRPEAARRNLAASRALGHRLRSLAGEVDDLWRASLQGQDFDLVWRSSEASLALHRAVIALEEGGVRG